MFNVGVSPRFSSNTDWFGDSEAPSSLVLRYWFNLSAASAFKPVDVTLSHNHIKLPSWGQFLITGPGACPPRILPGHMRSGGISVLMVPDNLREGFVARATSYESLIDSSLITLPVPFGRRVMEWRKYSAREFHWTDIIGWLHRESTSNINYIRSRVSLKLGNTHAFRSKSSSNHESSTFYYKYLQLF